MAGDEGLDAKPAPAALIEAARRLGVEPLACSMWATPGSTLRPPVPPGWPASCWLETSHLIPRSWRLWWCPGSIRSTSSDRRDGLSRWR